MKDYMLILVSVPELEEDIVDWLLERQEISGFTSNPIHGQSHEQRKLTIIEQVIGRQRRVMFHIHLKPDTLTPVLESLRKEFSGTGLDYWVIPVIESGRLS